MITWTVLLDSTVELEPKLPDPTHGPMSWVACADPATTVSQERLVKQLVLKATTVLTTHLMCRFSVPPAITAPKLAHLAPAIAQSISFAQPVTTALLVPFHQFNVRPVTTRSLKVQPNKVIVTSVHLVSRALEVPMCPIPIPQPVQTTVMLVTSVLQDPLL